MADERVEELEIKRKLATILVADIVADARAS